MTIRKIGIWMLSSKKDPRFDCQGPLLSNGDVHDGLIDDGLMKNFNELEKKFGRRPEDLFFSTIRD